MSDRLDERIREAVHELVASSPAPPERGVVAYGGDFARPVGPIGLGRPVALVLLVLVAGTAGILIGRSVFPATVDTVPAVGVPEVVVGQIGPEPRFDPTELGTEVPLLPPSGSLAPTLTAGGDHVGNVFAVGRVGAHEAEAFTWRTLREDVEGWCIQIVTRPTVEEVCSAARVPPATEGPRTVVLGPDSFLVAWKVPEGTSVVSIEAGDMRAWQRPIAGVALFVIEAPSSFLHRLHAWDADGVRLVEFGFTVSDPTSMTSGVVHGALPNGQAYVVSGLPTGVHAIEGVSAAILLDRPDGSAWAIGILHVLGHRLDGDTPTWDGDTLRVPTGDHSVWIDVYPQVLDDLGPGGRDFLADAIKGSSFSGMPILQLAPPLRFADDLEVPLHMAAQYATFSVLRGCDPEYEGVCSDDDRIQVVPNSKLYSGDYPPLPSTVRIAEVDPGSPVVLPDGWTIHEFTAFEPRIGLGSAIADDVMFVWGGATDGTGVVHSDGALIDTSTGLVTLVPEAPIAGRLSSSVVWTGSEFIVIGGQDFGRSYVDGAAFDPSSMTWRRLPDPPLSAASHPSAGFAAGAMYVWLPAHDTAYGEVPSVSEGQFARYHPHTNSWERLPSPPAAGHTARLFDLGGTPMLVIGPQMLEYGTPSPGRLAVTAIAFNPEQNQWLAPVSSLAGTDAAAAFVIGDSLQAGLVDGSVIQLTEDSWTTVATITPPCPLAIHGASASEVAFITWCGDLYTIQGSEVTPILLPDPLADPREPLRIMGQVLQARDDGTLVILGSVGLTGTGQPAQRTLLVLFSQD